MSGDYIVEEVNGDSGGADDRNRRLVFSATLSIQSEARLSVKKVKEGIIIIIKVTAKVEGKLVQIKVFHK